MTMSFDDPFSSSGSQPSGFPFQDFLEESDVGLRANFFSRPGTSGTPTRSRFFQNEFQNIQNLFLGRLGNCTS